MELRLKPDADIYQANKDIVDYLMKLDSDAPEKKRVPGIEVLMAPASVILASKLATPEEKPILKLKALLDLEGMLINLINSGNTGFAEFFEEFKARYCIENITQEE